jgi:hypothetical protein
LNTPVTVEEPVTARLVEVAPPVERDSELSSPVLDTEKSVEVADALLEPMAKSTGFWKRLWVEEAAKMLNCANGEVVPTPTLPLLVMMKEVLVEEPTTNWLLAPPAVGLMDRVAKGVVVPMPTLPAKKALLPVLKTPLTVVEPVTASEVEVAPPVLSASDVSRPWFDMEKSVVVEKMPAILLEEAMTKRVWLVEEAVAWSESCA